MLVRTCIFYFLFFRAIEDALLGTCSIDIPETLIIEQAREKFAIMMTEFKDQGESDEKIQSMITKEVSGVSHGCLVESISFMLGVRNKNDRVL